MSQMHRNRGAFAAALTIGIAIFGILVVGVIYFVGDEDLLPPDGGELGAESRSSSSASRADAAPGLTTGATSAPAVASSVEAKSNVLVSPTSVRSTEVAGTAFDTSDLLLHAARAAAVAEAAAARAAAGEDTSAAAPGVAARGASFAVLDAGTGVPIPNARVLVTAYHGVDELREAGYPALAQDVVDLGANGLEIPEIVPENPRALLHLQFDAPGYATEVTVARRRLLLGGSWRLGVSSNADRAAGSGDVLLRRARTRFVRVVAGGQALPRVPVRVTPTRARHTTIDDAETFVGPRANDRLLTLAEPYIVFTDDSGVLRLEETHGFYFLELLHPRLRLHHTDPETKRETTGRILYHLPAQGGRCRVGARRPRIHVRTRRSRGAIDPRR